MTAVAAPRAPEDPRLARVLPESLLVSPQVPLAAGDRSEPEPDLYVIDAAADPVDDHPTWAHLVVEVAATSQERDLVAKPRVYAAAGIPQYWVVDLPADEVVVHREPAEGQYRRADRLPLDTPPEVLGLTVSIEELMH